MNSRAASSSRKVEQQMRKPKRKSPKKKKKTPAKVRSESRLDQKLEVHDQQRSHMVTEMEKTHQTFKQFFRQDSDSIIDGEEMKRKREKEQMYIKKNEIQSRVAQPVKIGTKEELIQINKRKKLRKQLREQSVMYGIDVLDTSFFDPPKKKK